VRNPRITVSYLAPNGRFLSRMEGPRTGNVLLRRTQFRVADDPLRLAPISPELGSGQDSQPARCVAPLRYATTAKQ